MQTVSGQFTSYAQGDIRPLAYMVKLAFDKTFDNNIDFFTIGDSLIGGSDFIPGTGDVVQEWDKYQYADYSSRVIDVEWERETEQIGGVQMAMADVVFNNYDDYFTPGGGSEIENYILPYRPIRILSGFANELIPGFIGITEKMPVIDEKAKTATFHCIDFLYTLLNRPLLESTMLQNKRTDEVISTLFQLAGLLSVQLDLDEGINFIDFTYFEKGTKLINAINELVDAEQGKLYMDENGVITFKNRQNYNNEVVYNFDAYNNIIDVKTRKEDDIRNVVEIRGSVREVQPIQKIWQLPQAVFIAAGESKEYWADLQEPVTTVDDPVFINDATTSSFNVNTLSDGTGTQNVTDVTLTASDIFGKSFKMTFANSGSADLYITEIILFGTPAPIVKNIYVREQDATSVAKYDERVISIDNDFLQDEDFAQSKALIILDDFAEYGSIQELDVKGSMALQIDDTIRVNLFNRIGNYKITKITNKISFPAKFTQILRVKDFTARTYFRIGDSLIGGDDQISP